MRKRRGITKKGHEKKHKEEKTNEMSTGNDSWERQWELTVPRKTLLTIQELQIEEEKWATTKPQQKVDQPLHTMKKSQSSGQSIRNRGWT